MALVTTLMDLESKYLQFSEMSECVSFVDNSHERQIKYDGFGERPSVGGRPGVPGPSLKSGPARRTPH